jgi:hypothetical protein
VVTLEDIRWSWIHKSSHVESDKSVDNNAFMLLHSFAQLEDTVLRIMCTSIIQLTNLDVHMSV